MPAMAIKMAPKRRSIRLREQTALAKGLIVDRKKSIIRNVKVLGFVSANGRQYLPEAVRAAMKCYEGVMVNVDHPANNDDTRSAYDRCGRLINVRFVEGKGLYADLWLNPEHAITKPVMAAAETMPESYGLSHNAHGEGEENADGIFVVRKILDVRHVDLVADPATTRGLAEAYKPTTEGMKMEKLKPHLADIIDGDLATEEKIAKILGLVDLVMGEPETEPDSEIDEETETEPAPEEEDEKTAMEADGETDNETDKTKKETDEEYDSEEKPDDKKPMESRRFRKLSKELATLREDIRRTKRESRVRRLAESVKLPLTKTLLSDLMALPAESVERHIKRLAESANATRPRTLMPVQESRQANAGIPKDNIFAWLKD
jgi:hypothetical protein